MIWSNPHLLERLMYISIGISWGISFMSPPSPFGIFLPLVSGFFAGSAARWLNKHHPRRHEAHS